MKFLNAITAALLPFTALAAKKSASTDRFVDFRQQQLSAASSLKLNDESYAKLTRAPRDYSVAVLLTALEARFGCNLCQEFQPEWNLLAKTWAKGDKNGDSRLVLGTLDFTNGQKTFQAVRMIRKNYGDMARLTTIDADAIANRPGPPPFPPNHRPRRQTRRSPFPL